MDWRDALAEARRVLEARQELDAKLLVAAAVQMLAERIDVHPVVTGGTAVDFYAAEAVDEATPLFRGWKPSIDVDVVLLEADAIGGAVRLRHALLEAGFRPAGGDTRAAAVERERGWKHPDVPLPVEVIGHSFHGDRERIVELEVGPFRVRMRGPEDTLWEHIEWGAHTGDQASWTRALAIAQAQRERLDVEYLRRVATERHYAPYLEKCLKGEPLDPGPRR